MSTSPAPLIARVSRRDLARNPFVWRATGGMTVFISVTIAVLALLGEEQVSPRLVLVGGLCSVIGITLLRSQPTEIGTRLNHAVIALPYLASAAIFWGAQEAPGLAIGAAMFISPLAAVRLQDQKHFFAHLVAATVALWAGGLIGQVPPTTLVGVLCTCLAVWVLGISCWEILQSAEAQGDELERLVRRDPLTGLGNRRLLDESLPEELARHERAGRPLTVVCMDLTGFKALNDSLGHAEGDALLREVGVALDRIVRPVDTVVRQGGDEFTLLLTDTPPEHVARTTNAIRAALADLHFEGITTGIGTASYPADATAAAVLLHVADERLRADKEARRTLSAGNHPRRRASDRDDADPATRAGTPLQRVTDDRRQA